MKTIGSHLNELVLYVLRSTGSQVEVAESPIGRLGMTVCYDLRFPELYQELRFRHDAQVPLKPLENLSVFLTFKFQAPYHLSSYWRIF